MKSFETDAEAKAFVRERVDLPVADHLELLDRGALLRTFSHELDGGKFTNIYDLTFPAGSVRPSIELHDQLTSVFDSVASNPDLFVATGGGFFFLADQSSAAPRQLGLNLAFANGHMRSFPSVDREAVLCDGERLTVENVQALDMVSIGGAELSWSGSLTDHETDVKVFGNGNSVITHVRNDATGSIRVLDEHSRYTPEIDHEDIVDIGFIRRDDGVFVGINSSKNGDLDIFAHDVVMRAHEKHIHKRLPIMKVRTIGNKALDGSLQGAVSVGPMLEEANFTGHPINSDKSLGGKPPFLDVPLARTVLYAKDDGTMHLRLFYGRPGSPTFPGVTPQRAAETIKDEGGVVWGCFLDPGQTAKLVIKTQSELASYGNTHYLKWPSQPGDKFIWVPKTGRPVASMITFR